MKNIFNNKWVGLITLLLLAGNLVTLILLWTSKGHRPPPPPPPNNESIADFLIRELALNKEQQAKYLVLVKEHQSQMFPLQDSLLNAKEAFYKLLKDTGTTTAQVDAATALINTREKALNEIKYYHFKKLRAICTPEQQNKFDTVIQIALRRMGNNKGPKPKDAPDEDRPHRNGPPPHPNGPPPDGPPNGHPPDGPMN